MSIVQKFHENSFQNEEVPVPLIDVYARMLHPVELDFLHSNYEFLSIPN